MNLYPIFGFSTKTHILSQNSLFTLTHYIPTKSLYTNSFSQTHQILTKQQFWNLPFLIKLKFTKTIKTTIPTLTYAYVLPSDRFHRSNAYTRRLHKMFLKNSHSSGDIKSFYAAILKI